MILLAFYSMYQLPADFSLYQLLFNKFLDIKDRLAPEDPSFKPLTRVLNNFLLKKGDEVISDGEDSED